jgi:hypothetical protein
MWKIGYQYADNGVTLMPTMRQAKLTDRQKHIFKFYGYKA